jgi:purine catabolism regulator
MAVDGHGDLDVVTAVSGLTGASVVLENRTHQVLAYKTPPDLDSDTALRDWDRRSRRDGEGEGWIIGEARARGQCWGRLIAQLGPDRPANRIHRLAVHRGAENIALRRMIEGDGVFVELEARYELLSQLAHGHYRHEADGRLRAEAAGFPITGRTLVAVAVAAPGAEPAEIQQVVVRSAAEAHLHLLIGRDNAGLLSVLPEQDPPAILHAWSTRLRRELGQAVIGIGSPVTRLSTIRSGLMDATSAARAELAGGIRRPVVDLADVRARGLLAQLVHDPRLQSFVERELGPLLNRDQAPDLAALRAYLAQGRNKSAAAQAVQISRPAFYSRLQRAATLLHADLEDAETCLSLQLALLGLDLTAPLTSRPDQPTCHPTP